MKVLRLIGGLDPRHGGPPVSAVNSCIAARRQGIETTLVYGYEPANAGAIAPTLERLAAEGVAAIGLPYARIRPDTSRSWGVCPSLPRWLMTHRRDFDLVHCHGAWQAATAMTLMLVATAGRPCVLTPHESLTEFDIIQSPRPILGFVKRALQPTWLRGFDRVIVASPIEARDSEPPHIAGRVRFSIVAHAVFDERRRTAMPRNGSLRPGTLRVGFLGRLHGKKNVDLLIRALSRLPPQVTLAVAGDGPEHESLQRLAKEIGVASRIDWLGFIGEDAKASFLAGIDVLALPSAYECFGVAAAEAMAAGVPVIVSPDTGVAGTVTRCDAGAVADASVDSIAAMLATAAASTERLAAWSAHAIDAAQVHFSFAAHGRALIDCYERVMSDVASRIA